VIAYYLKGAVTAVALSFALSAAGSAAPSRVVQPGLDLITMDGEELPQEPEQAEDIVQHEDVSWSGAPVDLLKPIHHIYTDLRRQLVRYQRRWSSLPQIRIPEQGRELQFGASNRRVSTLRQRFGLGEGSFDLDLEKQVAGFQAAHGLPTTGKADADTLAALNRGAAYYERRLLLNMERARRLPAPGTAQKYVLVDAGSARLWMYENGQPVDSMKVVVGKTASATPMMAALMRFATVNPYWNVPPDLVAELIAPKVLSEGVAYLTERRYEVLDGWENDAKVIDAATVDWPAVAKGHLELRVRQLPGGANSMGAIKFMMPNEYGIYLHDTPSKALFAAENRWVSNGCVRLEDAERLARWVFGAMPRASDSKWEEHVPLQQAIPVYVTYLTVGATPDGPAFRADPYNRDKVVLERFAEAGDGMADANRPFQIDLSDLVEPSSEEIPAAKPLSAAAKPQPKAARPSALPTSKSTTDKAATAKAATAKAATAKETTAKAATQKGPTTKAVTKKPALQAPPLLNPLNTSPSKSSRPLPAKTKLSASVAPSEKRTGQKR
jgi:murein L,D-transpeptidase YcbB/YkuD